MKTKLFLFLILILAAGYGCKGDDPVVDDVTGKVTVSAEMQCKEGDTYVPDVGAKLYEFKGFRDYINYEYENGTFVHKTSGEVVKYTQKAVAGADGIATLNVEYGQYSLFVWESAKYPGKYGQNVYMIEKGKDIKVTGIYFEP